ncbi:hypothetical protein Pla108_38420 [Botrimarina colliarenosi]|uniref:PDZ domain-containing protein n=1 Tax=Botrimarina colliarenosi TaxID=2528001 RepID=A0A5C6A400_9BACT|nr:hypothetical protein [Botrimarina colliarenosi]TWT94130.1 hypothetical protein Pla108_38420 [Botrimarina colliarenosi]
MPRPDNQEQHRWGAYDYRTQAEDQRLYEEDRKREEQDRWFRENQRQQQLQSARPEQSSRPNPAPAAKQKTKDHRTPGAKPRTKRKWSVIAALIGLFAGLVFAGGQLGANQGVSWAVAVMSAVFCGRYYRQIIVVGLLLGAANAFLTSEQEGGDREAPIAESPRNADRAQAASRGSSPQQQRRTPTQPSQAPPARVVATTLSNLTPLVINYEYRWGTGDWQLVSLASNQSRSHPRPIGLGFMGTPVLEIRYDEDLSAEKSTQSRSLQSGLDEAPAQEPAPRQYTFVKSSDRVGLRSDQWQTGWPHPFRRGLEAAEEEGSWRAAEGYRLYAPGGTPMAVPVEAGVGLLGMTLRRDAMFGWMVYDVIEGSSAERAGIEPGFHIVGTTEAVFSRLDLKACRELLSGPVGTTVDVAFHGTGGKFFISRGMLRE